MTDFYMKQYDTRPLYERQLLKDGVAVDLTDADVYLLVRRTGFEPVIVNGECTVVNASGGTISYEWQSTDLVTNGVYDVEVEAYWPGTGARLTFPTVGYEKLTVNDDIGQGGV